MAALKCLVLASGLALAGAWVGLRDQEVSVRVPPVDSESAGAPVLCGRALVGSESATAARALEEVPIDLDGEVEPVGDPWLAPTFVEVTVVPARGAPDDWVGVAYVLPAGAPGVRWEKTVPHKTVRLDEAARIPVAVSGMYDVGLVAGGVHLLHTDVVCERGGASVRMVLPDLAPIRFRLDRPIPVGDASCKRTGFVTIQPGTPCAVRASYPGRGEGLWRGPLVMLEGGGQQVIESEPVPVEQQWTLDLEMRETRRSGDSVCFDVSREWYLRTDSLSVATGEEVALRVVSRGDSRTQALSDEPISAMRSPTATPNTGPLREPVSVELDSRIADGAYGRVVGLTRDGHVFDFIGRAPVMNVGGYARGLRALCFVGDNWASEVEVVPADGPWRPRLLAAGCVVFAPGRTLDPALGQASLRRADGMPLPPPWTPRRAGAGRKDSDLEQEVEPGSEIEPLAPGTLRLHVLVGGLLLQDVQVEVYSGRTTAVPLP